MRQVEKQQAGRPQFYAIHEVVSITTLSRATIYRKMAQGTFPVCVPISEGRVAWPARGIEEWGASRTRRQPLADPPTQRALDMESKRIIRPGQCIALLPIFALIPRLGLVVLSADRQAISPETRTELLWISSAALAALVGLAEVYVGMAVVSRRHLGLALVWGAITLSLNALIIPLTIAGLEAVP